MYILSIRLQRTSELILTEAMHPEFTLRIQNLRRRIHPLLALQSRCPHPEFPKTILHFHLMTERQLDSIAVYYSQAVRDEWSNKYPRPIVWDKEAFDLMDNKRRIDMKRRLVGRFIGIMV